MKRMTFDRHGFTLFELLIVLLIIGVLSTVAIRTIDATRNRALFDQTSAEMKEIAKAITGNPDLLTDGRRVDFGFYGDMRRLPNDLKELVENPTNAPAWNGPYVRRAFAGDSVGFMHDAWGNPYSYDKNAGTLTSPGDGQHTLTVRVADELYQLENNSIAGTITDTDNNPPGVIPVSLGLYTPLGDYVASATADAGGYYEFEMVKIGQYRLVAQYGVNSRDTIARWVNVPPRSRLVVDFRFSRPFRNLIRLVGTPVLQTDSSGFTVSLVNDFTENIRIDSVVLVDAPDSSGIPTAFMRDLRVNGTSWPGFPLYTGQRGFGEGDAVPLHDGLIIEARRTEIVSIGFLMFHEDSLGPPSEKAKLNGETFRLRFSDGSEMTFTLPNDSI